MASLEKVHAAQQDSILGLMQIPLELRNHIYDFTSPELTTLELPTEYDGTIFDFVSRQISPHLLVNRQVVSEARTAQFRRTMLNVTRMKVPGPEMLLLKSVPELEFKRLEVLEFTRPQFQPPDPGVPPSTTTTTEFGMHDALSRCPKLQNLTINVTAKMLIVEDKETKQPRFKTGDEMDAIWDVDRLLECKDLRSLFLICHDPNKPASSVGVKYYNIFRHIDRWMWQKIVDRQRQISFTIHMYICSGSFATWYISDHSTSNILDISADDTEIWYE